MRHGAPVGKLVHVFCIQCWAALGNSECPLNPTGGLLDVGHGPARPVVHGQPSSPNSSKPGVENAQSAFSKQRCRTRMGVSLQSEPCYLGLMLGPLMFVVSLQEQPYYSGSILGPRIFEKTQLPFLPCVQANAERSGEGLAASISKNTNTQVKA